MARIEDWNAELRTCLSPFLGKLGLKARLTRLQQLKLGFKVALFGLIPSNGSSGHIRMPAYVLLWRGSCLL